MSEPLCALDPRADFKSMSVRGQPVEQFGEVRGVLNVQANLGNPAPQGGRAGEEINDVPAVDRVGLDVEPLAHGASLPPRAIPTTCIEWWPGDEQPQRLSFQIKVF